MKTKQKQSVIDGRGRINLPATFRDMLGVSIGDTMYLYLTHDKEILVTAEPYIPEVLIDKRLAKINEKNEEVLFLEYLKDFI